jgi:putative DNA primase/helicase
VLRHPNKRSGAQALDRGSGAVGIGGAARVVLMFGWHPDDSEIEDRNQRRRAIAVSKVNVAAYAPTIAYSIKAQATSIETDGVPDIIDVPRVHWHGNIAASADDFVGAEGSNTAGDHDDAATFLRRVLEDGPMLADHVKKEGVEAGFSNDQLKRAKKRAGVVSDKQKELLGGKWFWTLKKRADPLCI